MSAQAAVVEAEEYAPPLRIGRRRQTIWAVGLVAFAAIPIVAATGSGGHGDWPAFWTAGRLVGGPDLADIGRQIAWQVANGLGPAYFPYPPPVALGFAPFATLSLGLSFWLWTALMAGAAVLAGWVLAPAYRQRRLGGILAVLAWAPVTASLAMGQNGPLGLLLAAIAIAALVRYDDLALGIATGLLLYKPTWGLPLVLLIVVRSRWRALGTVAAVATAGYLLGIVATGGDAAWPDPWLRSVAAYAAPDLDINEVKAISLPLLLERAGAPAWVALAAGVAVVIASIPRLRRARPAEAGAAVCLVGLAASPHALSYDAALAAPFLLWMLGGGIVEPWRTRLVAGAYLLGPLWLFAFATVVASPAVVVLGGVALWLSGRWRSDASPRQSIAPTPTSR